MPGARSDRVARFGQSRGGGAALQYAFAAGGVRALVLNSTGYPPEVIAQAPQLGAPVLILHGMRDSPADGGSAMTAVERARAFQAVLRTNGNDVDALYFDGGHNDIFANAAQYAATVERVQAFLKQKLLP